jgi:hypothetical protein
MESEMIENIDKNCNGKELVRTNFLKINLSDKNSIKEKKTFYKLSKNIFGYLLSFTDYGDFINFIIVNKNFGDNIRLFIRQKVRFLLKEF